MQTPVSLRISVHIEQPDIQSLVQTMLSQAGHHCLLDRPGEHSLAVYLQTILDELRQEPSSAYDALIVGAAEVETLIDTAVLLALVHLQGSRPVPILLISNAGSWQLRTWLTFEKVLLLPENHSMHHFFLALGRLTETFAGMPNPIFEQLSPGTAERYVAIMDDYEQLVAGERSRIAVRHRWLDQRQEWLEQRRAWLEERQVWLEIKERAPDPQHEWLQEQHAWLEKQKREVEIELRKVKDLRMWLKLYQQRIDEEHPPYKSAVQ